MYTRARPGPHARPRALAARPLLSRHRQGAIVVRNKHGHLIPRKQADGRVTDLNTNRCRCAAARTREAPKSIPTAALISTSSSRELVRRVRHE